MSRIILNAANRIISCFAVVVLLAAGAYAAYALWDNFQVYSAAGNVQADMLKIKPGGPSADTKSFEDLYAVNPDICAWLSVDGTQIDHPVLRGETNHSYINTDVYGNFALAGSIFLDSRNDRGFKDSYCLIHGHNMAGGKMFGDLSLFLEKDFFEANKTGQLILPDKAYDLRIFAVVTVQASDALFFKPTAKIGAAAAGTGDPASGNGDSASGNGESGETDPAGARIDALRRYTEQNAIHFDQGTLSALRADGDVKIIALATCTKGLTNARLVVLAAATESAGSA